VKKQEAQELLELLRAGPFSHDLLMTLSRRTQQILTNQGYRLPAEEVSALFAISRRCFEAAGSIEEIHGDREKHGEIEAAVRPPLLAVLENIASGSVDADAVKRLIVTRIQMEPGRTPH
jgi:hypothetical protein